MKTFTKFHPTITGFFLVLLSFLWLSSSNVTMAQTYNLPITGTDAIRCGAGELTLTVSWSASALDPANVKWYTVPNYGTPIATGMSYSTGYIEFTHTYFVDYIGSDGCSQCDRLLIRAVVEDQVITPQVIYPSLFFCNTANQSFVPTVVGANDGDFSIVPTVGSSSFSTETGSFNPFGLTAATYDVTFQPEIIEGCDSNPVYVTLTVTDAPEVPEIGYDQLAYCGSVTNASVIQTGASGGSYSVSPPGLTVNSTTGAIDPSTSFEGEYTVSYFVPASGGCPSVSDETTITINTLSVGGTATADASEISSGSSTVIRLAGYNGSIQWQSSPNNDTYSDLSEETSSELNTGALTSSTWYRAVVTNGVCTGDVSTVASVTVSAASVAGTAVGDPTTICTGSTSEISLSGYTGNIQWQSNETGSYVDIPSATADSYTTPILTNNTAVDASVTYRAVVTAGLSAPDISNVVTITIRPNPIAGLVIGDEICSGNNGTVSVFDYLGDAVQWQSSSTELGTYEDISGATSDSYTANSLASTTYYRAEIANSPCNVVYTDVVSILVSPPSVAGTASASITNMCTGGTTDLSLTGYTGSIFWEYQEPGASTWTYTGGNATFTSAVLNDVGTHKYRAKVTSGVCDESLSSTVEVTVVAQPQWDNYTAPTASITYGESVSFSVDVINGLGGTISWIRATSPGVAGTTVTSPDTPTAVGTYYYRPSYAATGSFCGLSDGTEYTVVVGQKELTVINASVTTKVYDGNTDATITGAELSGLVLGDAAGSDVVLGDATSGVFASVLVGTASVSTAMSISGGKASNYFLTQPNLSGIISAKVLTISDPSITKTKTYDGSTSAAVTAGTLQNVVLDDEVSIASTTATYDNANVGDNKTITVVYTITGAQANNYTPPVNFVVTDGEITALQLTIANPTITKTKVYDGNTSAVVIAGGLQNIVGSDDVAIATTTANYDNANIGSGKTITVAYTINGTSISNYLAPVDYSVTDGVIDPLQLTIANPTLTTSKVYDGNTTAAVTAGALANVVSPDVVTVDAVANYADGSAGSSKTITVVYSINGAGAGNYVKPVDYQVGTGEITTKSLTITGTFTASNKVFDGYTPASIASNSLTLDGIVGSDDVSLTAVANFETASIGNGKTVNLTSSTLLGDDIANYSLSFTGAPTTTANITEPIIRVSSTGTGEIDLPYSTLAAAFAALGTGNAHTGDVSIYVYENIAGASLDLSSISGVDSVVIIPVNSVTITGGVTLEGGTP